MEVYARRFRGVGCVDCLLFGDESVPDLLLLKVLVQSPLVISEDWASHAVGTPASDAQLASGDADAFESPVLELPHDPLVPLV